MMANAALFLQVTLFLCWHTRPILFFHLAFKRCSAVHVGVYQPDTAGCPACWYWTLSLQRRGGETWRPSWSLYPALSVGENQQQHSHFSEDSHMEVVNNLHLQKKNKTSSYIFPLKLMFITHTHFTEPSCNVLLSPAWREPANSSPLLWTAWISCWMDEWALW